MSSSLTKPVRLLSLSLRRRSGERVGERGLLAALKPRVEAGQRLEAVKNPALPPRQKTADSSPTAGGSSLPTCRVRNSSNPERIPQQSPRLSRKARKAGSYPGSIASGRANPNAVASEGGERGHNHTGVETRFAQFPRVARRLATLGWRTQSLWDCHRGHSRFVANDEPGGQGERFILHSVPFVHP